MSAATGLALAWLAVATLVLGAGFWSLRSRRAWRWRIRLAQLFIRLMQRQAVPVALLAIPAILIAQPSLTELLRLPGFHVAVLAIGLGGLMFAMTPAYSRVTSIPAVSVGVLSEELFFRAALQESLAASFGSIAAVMIGTPLMVLHHLPQRAYSRAGFVLGLHSTLRTTPRLAGLALVYGLTSSWLLTATIHLLLNLRVTGRLNRPLGRP